MKQLIDETVILRYLLDFVDCMLVAHNAVRGEQVMSFDKPLVKHMLKM